MSAPVDPSKLSIHVRVTLVALIVLSLLVLAFAASALAAQWDFNGDGKADILWRHTSGSVAVWLMDGATFLSGGVPGTLPVDTAILGVGDFNGDTKSDILWQNDNGVPGIWHMNGLSVISAGVAGSFNPGPEWHIIA